MKRLAVVAAVLLLAAACKSNENGTDTAMAAPAAMSDSAMQHDSMMKDSAMKHDTGMAKDTTQK